MLDLRDFGARNLVMPDHVHPTAFGQIAIAERALDLLAAHGLEPRSRPSSWLRVSPMNSMSWGTNTTTLPMVASGDACSLMRAMRRAGCVMVVASSALKFPAWMANGVPRAKARGGASAHSPRHPGSASPGALDAL